MAVCSIDGCQRDVLARGLCPSHYSREYKARRLEQYPLSDRTATGSRSPLPNPWIHVAPSCPAGHPPARVRLWAPDGPWRWICVDCRRLFTPAAARTASGGEPDRQQRSSAGATPAATRSSMPPGAVHGTAEHRQSTP